MDPPPLLQALSVREALQSLHSWWPQHAASLSQLNIFEIKEKISNLSMDQDVCVWMGTSDGKFSTKSAWQLCRQKQNTRGPIELQGTILFPPSGQFWGGKLFKGSFLLMSICRKKVFSLPRNVFAVKILRWGVLIMCWFKVKLLIKFGSTLDLEWVSQEMPLSIGW